MKSTGIIRRIDDLGRVVRCDHCGKWFRIGNSVTLPEELYSELKCDNEFGICLECSANYSIDYWRHWLSKKR